MDVYPQMALLETIDLTVFVNLILSLTIVAISLWGYSRIGKPTPLYFGVAYVLFAFSHFILLTGQPQVPATVLILMRIAGYILVAVGLFALITVIIERKKAEDALRESEEHLSATFDQTAVGIAEFLPDARICRYNHTFAKILCSTGQDLSEQLITDFLAEDEARLPIRAINPHFQDEPLDWSGEILVIRNDRSRIWCQSSLSAVRTPEGKPKYFILALADITERKRAEEALAELNSGLELRVAERTRELESVNTTLVDEIRQRSLAEEQLKASVLEKEILIKEIHHRVKNNLQIIISLLYFQSKKTDDPSLVSALVDSQTRVKSMALVHEKLYQSGNLSSIDFNGYLQNLVSNLMISYDIDQSRIRVTISAHNLPLTINMAIPLGLIMNELVSNAMKYAFPDGGKGELTITGSVQDEQIIVKVRDNGRGIPEGFDWRNTDSLGLHLVQMLTRQLKGTIDLDPAAGTEFTLKIPIKNSEGNL